MIKLMPVLLACLLSLAACGTSANETNGGMDDNSKQDSEEMEQNSDMEKAEKSDQHEDDKVMKSEEEDDHNGDNAKGNEEGEHHEGEGHHDANLSFDLNKTTAKANEETEVRVSLQKADEILSGADVRYEYWIKGEEKHVYTEKRKNSEQGEYKATVNFPESGTYQFKIHVYKGEEVHTHKKFEFIVK